MLELDRLFPDKLPDTLTAQEMLLKAGERRVLRFLIAEAQRQHGMKLETTRVFRISSKARIGGDTTPAASSPGGPSDPVSPTAGGVTENGWRNRPHKPAA